MELKYVNLYVVEGELFTWEGLDIFKINKKKIEYLYVEAPKLEVGENLYLIKGKSLCLIRGKYIINGGTTSEVELIKYEGYGRYTSLGNIEEDNLKLFMNI